MEEIMNYQARKEEIRKKLKETAEDFVYIGYQLKQVKANREYEQDGYKDVLEFARKEYGLHKDDTYRFIRINDKYSRGGNSMELDERFRGIAQTKLSEMLSLPDKDLELVTPETNREDIRELKRFNSQKPEEAPEEKGNDLQNIILEFFRPAAGRPAGPARQVLLDLLAVVEGKSKDPVLTQEEQIQELLNPKGNGVFRAGRYMVFMYDASQGMKYKIFGKSENHSVSYLAFAKTAHLIFVSGSKNPELDPWENQYGREEEERASQPEPEKGAHEEKPQTKEVLETGEEEKEKDQGAAGERSQGAAGEGNQGTAGGEGQETEGEEDQMAAGGNCPDNPEEVSLSMSDSKANEVQAGLKAPTLPRYVDNSENHETEEKKEKSYPQKNAENSKKAPAQLTGEKSPKPPVFTGLPAPEGEEEPVEEKNHRQETDQEEKTEPTQEEPVSPDQMSIEDYQEALPEGYIKCHDGSEVKESEIRNLWKEVQKAAELLYFEITETGSPDLELCRKLIEQTEQVDMLLKNIIVQEEKE